MKIFPSFRANFMKSCIFLINKSDIIKNEKDKDKIKEKIFKIYIPTICISLIFGIIVKKDLKI